MYYWGSIEGKGVRIMLGKIHVNINIVIFVRSDRKKRLENRPLIPKIP